MSKTFKCSRLYRSAAIRADDIDAEKRTIELSFSSTEPVDRLFGDEILLHGADNVDLSRLNDGGPLLSDHDTKKQIGVVERAWLDGKKGRALIRFSQNPAGEAEFQDVQDGIRRNVSVGYRINEIREKKKTNTVEVTRWVPLEISLVSVAADPTVGVGREAAEQNDVTIIEDRTMSETNQPQPAAPAPVVPVQPEPVRAENPPIDINEIRKQELARINELQALGRHFNESDLAQKAINSGASVSDFNRQLIGVLAKRSEQQSFIGLSPREIRDFSFLRIIRALAFPNDRRYWEEAAYEREASAAITQKTGISVRGIAIPYDVMQSRAPLDTGTATAAAELVGTDHLASSFIDVLRNRTRVIPLGARLLTGLVGNVDIPKQTGASQAGWISPEGSDAAESALTTGQVQLSPKTLGAWTEYTRQLVLQSDPSIEMLVRADLAAAAALEIDRAALYGSGASGQPSGITTLVTQMTPRFAGAVPTWGEVVDMESHIASQNGDIGTMGYLVNANMRGGLKQTEKASGTAQFVWSDDNMVNGYRAEVSNQVVDGDAFFADWAQLLIGMWGALDITVDPYSNSKSGTMRVVMLQSVDNAVRHTESFAWNNDTP